MPCLPFGVMIPIAPAAGQKGTALRIVLRRILLSADSLRLIIQKIASLFADAILFSGLCKSQITLRVTG